MTSSCLEKYDVFISFRGEDTRNNFTAHLYEALRKKKIKTYIDENSLKKGDEISSALLKAIRKSKICIIVFSENYASSTWCLNEVNHILQWKGENKQVVIPIFYHVDPSHVRHQQGSYKIVFDGLERRFKDEMETVQKWRDTLAKVADLSGWHADANRSEPKLIKEIVKDVLKKLDDCTSLSDDDDDDDYKDMAGIDEPIRKIVSLLCVNLLNVRIVGLWGMGGIGKTTLARVVFKKLSSQFEGSLFLENVKEEMKKHQSDELRKIVFSKLLKEKELNEINRQVKNRLRHTKVLLVLDDVDDVHQLESLAKDRSWFGSGSRIIVTTRNVQLLNNIEADEVYKVEELNLDDALQLFCTKAFHGNSPTTDYLKLSKRVVTNYAKGNPLALKVLGCHLHSRSIEEWESESEKLQSFPHKKIHDVLKISYDGLSDNTKDVFLDTACFFTSMDKKEVQRILGYSYVGVITEIRDLINKSLVTINDKDYLVMHDLVRDMGREIVRQQSTVDPGKRSRLWSTGDVCHVLKRDRGTPELQAMSLKMNKVSDALLLEPLVFKKMCNLRFLDFSFNLGSGGSNKVLIQEDIQLPPDIKYLKWDRFSSSSLPPNFLPENVAELVMCHSQLEQLLIRDKHLKNLKVINLSHSRNLNQIEDLIKFAPNLEEIDLSFTAIEQVPESIRSLSRLTTLRFDHCYHLERLPTSICKLKFLKLLSLTYCFELNHFPEILEPMESLEQLHLDATTITELPAVSMKSLMGLKVLTLAHCGNLLGIQLNIYNKCLEHLDVSFCPELGLFPKLPCSIKFLKLVGCHTMKNEFISSAMLLQSLLCKDLDHMVTHSSLLNELYGKNMLGKFQRGLFDEEVVSLAHHHELQSNRVRGIGILLQATKLPAWFNHQSQGPVITMRLGSGWYNANFMGFAICVVLQDLNISENSLDLRSIMRFKFDGGVTRVKNKDQFSIQKIQSCSSYLMRSVDEDDFGDVSSAVEVSFEFSGRLTLYFNVKMCGIRILYCHDVEEFCNANKEFIQYLESNLPAIVVPKSSGYGTINFGTDISTQHQLGSNVSNNEAESSDSRAAAFNKRRRPDHSRAAAFNKRRRSNFSFGSSE